MRDTQPVHVLLFGNRSLAAQYIQQARTLLGMARVVGLPRMARRLLDGTLIEVIAASQPPVLSITAPVPVAAGQRDVFLVYQFLGTGPLLERASDGTPVCDGIAVTFGFDAHGALKAFPVRRAPDSLPVRIEDATVSSPVPVWPDADAVRDRAGRVLLGPRPDGPVAVAMGAFNTGPRARTFAGLPYPETQPLHPMWLADVGDPPTDMLPDGLDAVHGHGMARVVDPMFGTRDFVLLADSYSRLWIMPAGAPRLALPTEMALPAWVFRGADDAPIGERAAYKWRFRPDGRRALAVVFERFAPVSDGGGATVMAPGYPSHTVPMTFGDVAPVRLDASGLVEIDIDIRLTGRRPADFAVTFTLASARRTADFDAGLLAADYARADGALVLAMVDLYMPDAPTTSDRRSFALLSVGREGEAPAWRGRLYDLHERVVDGKLLTDWLWTGIGGLDLRELAAVFVVKQWRQESLTDQRIAHTLAASIIAFVHGEPVDAVHAGDGAQAQWDDMSIPPGMHRLHVGDAGPVQQASRADISAGDPDTLVDAGLWQYGALAAALNDTDAQRGIVVHPDGHYAVCTAPTLTYSGPFESRFDAPYLYDPTGFSSLCLDVLAIRDESGTMHRFQHLDLLNEALATNHDRQDFGLSVLLESATNFSVRPGAGGAAYAEHSARHLFGFNEYDAEYRLMDSSGSLSFDRALLVNAPMLATQSVFWWEERRQS